jgi:acetyl esterase/lipase
MRIISRVKFCRAILSLSLLFLGAGCFTRVPRTVKVEPGIEYASVGGQSLRLDMFSPKQPAGKLPVLVWLHPGSWKGGSKENCPIAFLAAQDFAVVSLDYRLDDIAPFPAQLYDCKGAIRWLRAHADQYDLDAKHIGIIGASAGGHLGLLLATTADNPQLEGDVGGNAGFSSRVQCVCALYAPTELNRLVEDPKVRQDPNGDVARFIGGAVAQNTDKALAASPLAYVTKDCAPVFLMHGGADKWVPPYQSQIFYDALIKAGVEARLEIIPHKGHGINAPRPVALEILQFLNAHLGKESVPAETSR